MISPRFDREGEPDEIGQSANFADLVRDIVAKIPCGKVATYGDIALGAGAPRNARRVGWVLNGLPSANDLPCHRVVNRHGYLSGGWKWGHPDIMKNLLLDEKVPFKDEYTVDIERCHWFPWEDTESAASHEVDDLDLIPGGDRN
jgi:methylated-DNA-protein-cysteine methyltransferase-like protein